MAQSKRTKRPYSEVSGATMLATKLIITIAVTILSLLTVSVHATTKLSDLRRSELDYAKVARRHFLKPPDKPKPVKKLDPVKDNPNKCDLATEYVYPDFTCHPKPKPSPQNKTTQHNGDCRKYEWDYLLEKYAWDIQIARAVMCAESKGNPNASNTSDVHRDYYGNVICIGSFGLMQISCHSGKVYDPARNIQIAWQKYKDRGWSPWGAYTDGRYLQYL